MFQVNMVCHLWDLLDEGLEEVLDRVGGELGVSGICVPVVCGRLALLRRRPQAAPRIFRTTGGLFFAPQDGYYESTRLNPGAPSWLRHRNPLQQVAEQCARRNLNCRAVVRTSSADFLAARNPRVACKTVFGDARPDRICLVNPDVQALLIGLCRDLADNYQISAIELSDFHAGRIGTGALGFEPRLDFGPGGRALLEMCFCESCRQLGAGHGVDVASAARSADVRLGRIMETSQPLDLGPAQLLADDPPLGEYLACQWRALAGLLETLGRECARPVILHTYDDLISESAATHPLAGDGVIGGVEALLASIGHACESEMEKAARGVVTRTASEQAAEVQISPPHGRWTGPRRTGAPWLVRGLSRCAELGIRSANLDNYGQLPDTAWSGVRQAVRFARRSGGTDG